MFWRKKTKERGLYYMLPGMTRCNKRRREQIFRWSIAFGIIFSAVFGLLLYLLNHPNLFKKGP